MAYHEALRATRVLAGLRLRRLHNIMTVTTLRRLSKGVAKGDHRQATPAKAGIGWLVMLCVAAMMASSFGNSTRAFLLTLYCQGNAACSGISSMLSPRIAAYAHMTPFSDGMTRGMTMLMSVMGLFALLYPFVSSMRSGPDWDFEWIATLPMTRTTLLCTRIAERALINPTAWLAFGITGGITAWYANAGWLTPLYTLLIIPPLLLLVASLWTVLDLGLHVMLPPAALRNFQAILMLVVGPVVYLVMSLQSPTARHYALMLAGHTPQWAIWTPPGVAIQILSAPFELHALSLYGILLVEAGMVALLSVLFLRFQLRAGIVTHGLRESGRSARHTRKSREDEQTRERTRNAGRVWLSPVKRRELILLLRDRRHLIQCLGLPLMMVFGQFLLNDHLGATVMQNPAFTASVAFFIGAYTFMQTVMPALITEGERLWLLYTFPRSLAGVLLEKAQFYCGIALIYPLLLFAGCMTLSHLAPWHFAVGALLVLLGLPIYAVIALSLGVLSGMPAETGRRQLGIRYAYLFMALAGFYIYALASRVWWQQITTPILCGALAFALWQKASDRLPYLLDPTATPPSQVSLADGLIAAMLFFVLQFIAGYVLKQTVHVDAFTRVLLGYVCAGAVTYLLMRTAFWSLKTRGIPHVLGPQPIRAVAYGAAIGVLCGGVGLLYLWLTRRYGFAPAIPPTLLSPSARLALCALTVCAAPVFEEFVFRGLIFGGMRRSLNVLLSALGSAGLFAIVHPPFSMLPVFVLGLGTAWVYGRKKMLLASMATHAVYNAIVVGFQLATLYT